MTNVDPEIVDALVFYSVIETNSPIDIQVLYFRVTYFKASSVVFN